KAIFWFLLASITSLTIGLVMVRWLEPGAGLHLSVAAGAAKPEGVDVSSFTIKDFIAHVIPVSIIDAMAKNEILQIVVLAVFVGGRALGLFAAVRQPALLAFSTASSEAAYPRTLEELQRFGVAPRIASFVLPLGYSFNLDGSMMYCTFATLFICQAYGVTL